MRRSRAALYLAVFYAGLGLAGVWFWAHANESVLTWRHARGWGTYSAMMAMPWYLVPMFVWPEAPRSLTTAIWVVGIVINSALVWLMVDAWNRR